MFLQTIIAFHGFCAPKRGTEIIKKKKKTHPGILGWFYPAEGVRSLSLTPVTVQRSLEAN